MNNLFQKKYKENWKIFFKDDPLLATMALHVCETGIVKVDHNEVQKDCTDEELWKKLSNK